MMCENVKSGQASAGRTESQWLGWAALFELASMGLLPITEELAGALVSGEYAEACLEAAEVAGAANLDVSDLDGYCGADIEESFHELRRERTRLLVGERRPLITPYVGVWHAQQRGERGQLMVGVESMAIERYMRRCGVVKDLAAGQSNDPIDHVGTVCEFMHYLCLVAARAVAAPEGVSVSAEDAGAFHVEHFAGYAKWLAGRLREEAAAPYYRFLALLTECLAKEF